MNALKGALSVILLELSWYVCPPDHDPAFLALPVSARVFYVLAMAALIAGAMFVFLWGLDDRPAIPPAKLGGER